MRPLPTYSDFWDDKRRRARMMVDNLNLQHIYGAQWIDKDDFDNMMGKATSRSYLIKLLAKLCS